MGTVSSVPHIGYEIPLLLIFIIGIQNSARDPPPSGSIIFIPWSSLITSANQMLSLPVIARVWSLFKSIIKCVLSAFITSSSWRSPLQKAGASWPRWKDTSSSKNYFFAGDRLSFPACDRRTTPLDWKKLPIYWQDMCDEILPPVDACDLRKDEGDSSLSSLIFNENCCRSAVLNFKQSFKSISNSSSIGLCRSITHGARLRPWTLLVFAIRFFIPRDVGLTLNSAFPCKPFSLYD